MFGRKNKKEDTNNPFGDKNYKMKDEYTASELLVANFERVSSFGAMVETTEQNYIFETIEVDGIIKYREIFTGFIAIDEVECFNLPYVVNPTMLIESLPEIESYRIPKLSLIWMLNAINNKNKDMQFKKK